MKKPGELISDESEIDSSLTVNAEHPTNDFVPPSTYKYKENSNMDFASIRDNILNRS